VAREQQRPRALDQGVEGDPLASRGAAQGVARVPRQLDPLLGVTAERAAPPERAGRFFFLCFG